MRYKKKMNQESSKRDRLRLSSLPTLHLFTNGRPSHGPYFDIEFLKAHKHMVQERVCHINDMVSPSNE